MNAISVLKRTARLGVCLAVALCAGTMHAQFNSNTASVIINATLAEILTVSATSPATIALVQNGPATTATPVAITTTWLLKASRSSVSLYGWFATPSVALTDGLTPANVIPSSVVSGRMTTGTPTTFTAFTQSPTLGTASGGLTLFTQSITSSNRASSRSDNLDLKIDLTTLPQLPAGSYSGTLTLQAQAP